MIMVFMRLPLHGPAALKQTRLARSGLILPSYADTAKHRAYQHGHARYVNIPGGQSTPLYLMRGVQDMRTPNDQHSPGSSHSALFAGISLPPHASLYSATVSP